MGDGERKEPEGGNSDSAAVADASANADSTPAHQADPSAVSEGAVTDSASDPQPEDPPASGNKEGDDADKKSSAEETDATAADEDDPKPTRSTDTGDGAKPVAIVASSKKSRPPYKYDPDKITLRFLFANRDGLTVTVECKPSDTVGEVKGALLSVWPEDLPDCEGGELLRLVCMGRGFLMPDTRTLEDCQIPVFKTHPTPVNVSVKPGAGKVAGGEAPSKSGGSGGDAASSGVANPGSEGATSQGCACVIL